MTERYRFFGGKGGVGKTTCAAAAAVDEAEQGRTVLAVSTDPAHSLGDALARSLGPAPRRVPTRRGALHAVELDGDRALARWLGPRRRPLRMIAERGTYLDEDDVERLLRLSFPGVDELVTLLELTRLARGRGYDLVIVDTAPTGHTLRLLATPEVLRRIAGVLGEMHAKHRFLAASLGGRHDADVADRLIDELDGDARALDALLRAPDRCRFSWVLLAEPLAVAEARAGIAALAGAGIAVREVVVNRLAAASPRCGYCRARRAGEAGVLADAAILANGVLRLVRAREAEPRGVAALRPIGRALRRKAPRVPAAPSGRLRWSAPPSDSATAAIERLAPPEVRLLAFMGKGGVGKTTAAAATAVTLAERRPGTRILLLSTDPAHSLADVLGRPVGDRECALPEAPGLRVRELDADRAFHERRERYRDAVDRMFGTLLAGRGLELVYDQDVMRRLLDLAPPGLDELFAVLAMVDALLTRKPPEDLVILDTAPTGHALRLLEMPGVALGWVHALLEILLKYRQVVGLGEFAHDLLDTARGLRQLQALLADRQRTRAVVVTRAAELPRLETRRLLHRLRRLGVPRGPLFMNALTPRSCAGCRRGAAREAAEIGRLGRAASGSGVEAIIAAPAEAPPPRGPAELGRWAGTWHLRP